MYQVQSAIKYLVFLAEGSALFDAALGSCDFEMARAVARQCQMDPKIYLPLLKVYIQINISK
jgi:elongator complex protein 1